MYRQYLWNGTILGRTIRSHKVAYDIVTLSQRASGVGVIDYKAKVIVQAAKTVFSWNSRQCDKPWAAFNLLLQPKGSAYGISPMHTYPIAARTSTVTLNNAKTIYQIGFQRANAAITTAYPQPKPLTQAKSAALTAMKTPERGLRWVTSATGEITISEEDCIEWHTIQQRITACTPPEIKSFWRTFPWFNNEWVTGEDGQPLQQRAFSLIRITTLGELELEQLSPTTYRFKKPFAPAREVSGAALARLARWVRVIIAQCRVGQWGPTVERVYDINNHPTFAKYEWTLAQDGQLTGKSTSSTKRVLQ